jgi:hypothetical protein
MLVTLMPSKMWHTKAVAEIGAKSVICKQNQCYNLTDFALALIALEFMLFELGKEL